MSKTHLFLLGAIALISHALLYLAFAVNVGVRELITSVLVGGIAAAAMIIVIVNSKVHYKVRARDLLQCLRMPGQIVTGLFQVLKGFGQQLFRAGGAESVLAQVPFDVGQTHNPSDAGRHAFAVSFTTATPNTVIFGIVKEQRIMLYHQLVPAELSVMTRKLGARP